MHRGYLDCTRPCTIVAFRVLLQNNIVLNREKWVHLYPSSPIGTFQLLKSLKDSSNSKEIFIMTSFFFIPTIPSPITTIFIRRVELLKSLKDSSNSKEIFIMTSFFFIPTIPSPITTIFIRRVGEYVISVKFPSLYHVNNVDNSKTRFMVCLSCNLESRNEKMSKMKNIHAAKVFNTFLDHIIDMLGLKKKSRIIVKEFVS